MEDNSNNKDSGSYKYVEPVLVGSEQDKREKKIISLRVTSIYITFLSAGIAMSNLAYSYYGVPELLPWYMAFAPWIGIIGFVIMHIRIYKLKKKS